MSDPDLPTPRERTAFRAFVRDHHPDRGGDPATFAAGVERFRAGSVDGAADHTADPDGPAGPTPDPLPFAVRVGVALIRTWRRRRHGSTDEP